MQTARLAFDNGDDVLLEVAYVPERRSVLLQQVDDGWREVESVQLGGVTGREDVIAAVFKVRFPFAAGIAPLVSRPPHLRECALTAFERVVQASEVAYKIELSPDYIGVWQDSLQTEVVDQSGRTFSCAVPLRGYVDRGIVISDNPVIVPGMSAGESTTKSIVLKSRDGGTIQVLEAAYLDGDEVVSGLAELGDEGGEVLLTLQAGGGVGPVSGLLKITAESNDGQVRLRVPVVGTIGSVRLSSGSRAR
ncbi:MAG: hypothetical protein AAF628_32025 [Planctomycetota bacterium]